MDKTELALNDTRHRTCPFCSTVCRWEPGDAKTYFHCDPRPTTLAGAFRELFTLSNSDAGGQPDEDTSGV